MLSSFDDYFTCVANNIGFDDTIPTDYYTDVGFSSIINKYCRHPSIVKINENTLNKTVLQFERKNSQDVAKIINCFDCKKAPGCDKMPMKLLQKCAKYIAPDIAKLINDSLKKCIFPDDLKFAEVSSLFKRNDALNKSNYRPVSVLIPLSKICEKAVCIQVTDHFNSIFAALLSAFRKGYSCQSTLLNMVKNVKCALDKGEYVACMDISKAFDCLPHCLTICKLHAYGFSRDACKLIASYLYKGKQRVKICEIKSGWKEMNKGVPQGSIFGPLIFNIFMNDLFYFVKQGNLFNYAEDNSVSVNHEGLNVVSRLRQAEDEVTVQWFSENAMQANPAKFQGILLKGNKDGSDFKVCIRGQDIDFSRSITALRIYIDENLTFDNHVSNICLKASRQIGALQRLIGLLDLPSRRASYTSFIVSNFNCCPLV